MKQILNIVITCALAIFIVTLLFRFMHWPGGGIFASVSSIVLLVTTGFIVFSEEGFKVSKEYMLILFLFIFIMDGLLPENGWRKLHCTKDCMEKIEGSIVPLKMNVLYIGVENPMEIVVSGFNSKELEIKTDNGDIVATENGYISRPAKTGMAMITVSSKGRILKESQFRVKMVPDPVAMVAGIKGAGAIDKNVLLEQKGVVAIMENFDFDLVFKVVEFTVSAPVGKYAFDIKSSSNQFTNEQYDLIKKIEPGKKVYIENIKAVGPDGSIRQLGSMWLIIK
jgi:gliding motility-associated protein GldM